MFSAVAVVLIGFLVPGFWFLVYFVFYWLVGFTSFEIRSRVRLRDNGRGNRGSTPRTCGRLRAIRRPCASARPACGRYGRGLPSSCERARRAAAPSGASSPPGGTS